MSREARAARRLQASAAMLAEIPPADISDTLAVLRPSLARIRRGEWRLEVAGPASPHDRDVARMLPLRLLELCDLLDGRG